MAYYSAFIWMVVIQAIVGLSSAVLTDNKMDLSEENLTNIFNYAQALNRGSFASPQIDITEFGIFYQVREILFTTIRELNCNYTYDMLIFMHLMTPDSYADEKLCEIVDRTCGDWPQNMLNARVNNNWFSIWHFPYNLWMFYFYTKKMKTFAAHGAKSEMDGLHDHAKAHFKLQLQQYCKQLWPKNYIYRSYADELRSLDRNSALDKITKACAHLGTMAKSQLDRDIESSLYFNNVVEDVEIMRTLATSFGGLDSGDRVVEILYDTMNKAKNPMSSLSDSIHSLKRVHSYFMQMVKTVMLRLCWACLDSLKSLSNRQIAEQVQTLLYKQQLNDFVRFFRLNDDDDLVKLVAEISPGSMKIDKKMSTITSLLRKYDTANGVIIFSNHKRSILRKVKCETSTLVDIAKGIGYNIDTRSSIRKSILCAEIFVEYLKHILADVNFQILESFKEFDYFVWVKK